MATKALITPEQYLATHFEREPELVHGELVERPVPTFPHGDLHLELGSRLRALRRSYPVHTGVEVRVQIASDVFRVPDISMSFGYPIFRCGPGQNRLRSSRSLRPFWLSKSVPRMTYS